MIDYWLKAHHLLSSSDQQRAPEHLLHDRDRRAIVRHERGETALVLGGQRRAEKGRVKVKARLVARQTRRQLGQHVGRPLRVCEQNK